MGRDIEVDSSKLEWKPTRHEGVSSKSLRKDEQAGSRSLMKFEPNSYMTRHMHPAGEEVLVLEGRIRVEETWYEAGCYLYSPPGSSDDVYSDTGAVLFVALPRPAVYP